MISVLHYELQCYLTTCISTSDLTILVLLFLIPAYIYIPLLQKCSPDHSHLNADRLSEIERKVGIASFVTGENGVRGTFVRTIFIL